MAKKKVKNLSAKKMSYQLGSILFSYHCILYFSMNHNGEKKIFGVMIFTFDFPYNYPFGDKKKRVFFLVKF